MVATSSLFQRLFAFKRRQHGVKYAPISELTSNHNDSEPEESQLKPSDMVPKPCPLLPWVLTVLFGVLAVLEPMTINRYYSSHCSIPQDASSFATGFTTDFVSARPHIELQKKTFTGGLSVYDNGTLFVPRPSPVRYVGNPYEYPEIDENWERATWGRYVLITEDEARNTWGKNYRQYWDDQRGGYVVGYDKAIQSPILTCQRLGSTDLYGKDSTCFTPFHCLNDIRKTFWPQYYPDSNDLAESEDGARHMDHCIDQIRQYIVCSGDRTAIGTKYYAGLGRNYVDSDVAHTCRNFEKLLDWMVDRYNGPGAVFPVDRNM